MIRRVKRLPPSEQPRQSAQTALANNAVHNMGDKWRSNRQEDRAVSHEFRDRILWAPVHVARQL